MDTLRTKLLAHDPAPNPGVFRIRRARVLMAVLVLGLWGCGAEDQMAEISRDSWYREFGSFDPSSVTLPGILVYPVRPEAMAEAEMLLIDVPIVRLGWNEAYDLAGRRIELPPELSPFLIRGVSRGEGSFFVKQSQDALWVGHTGNGDADAPMQRRALVVMLDSWSFDVYVTTGTVQGSGGGEIREQGRKP